jgi:prolyl oligopeptidase
MMPTLLLAALLLASPSYPAAPRTDALESLHGVPVPDPFRALEDMQSPATQAWVRAQQELVERQVGMSAGAYERRIAEVQSPTSYWTAIPVGKRTVLVGASGATGGSAPAVVVSVREGQGAPRVVLDAARAGGALSRHVAADPHGRRLAYLVGDPGSRWLRLRVHALEGPAVSDQIDGLHTTAPHVAWLPGGEELLYVHFVRPSDPTGELPAPTLRRHRLGRPTADDVTLLAPDPAWRSWLTPHVFGDLVVVEGARGTSGRSDLWTGTPFALRPVALGIDGTARVLGRDGSHLLVETTLGGPRGRLVAVPLDGGPWRERVGESDQALVSSSMAGSRLLVLRSRDGQPVLAQHRLDGRFEREVALPQGRNVWGPPWGFGVTGPAHGRHAFFNATGLADPGTLYRLDTTTGRLEAWLASSVPVDPDAFVTRHVMATSGDGTRFPLFVVHHRDVRADGRRPVILYAYGALAWSAFPWYQPQMVAFLEKGGVFALAGVRGGGEYGEDWHRAGSGRHRKVAIADVLAAARAVVALGWSTPSRVVAQGGSLGSALVAAAAIQDPQAFGAVLLDIPVLDLVRYGRFTGGHLWRDEISRGETADDVQALLAVSPYHMVRPGCQPPTLVTAGSRDEVAVPLHAYKHVAALQAAQSCPAPILLQVVEGAGHSVGSTPQQAARTWARQLAFLERLGLF